MNVAVFRTGGIGDVILTLACLEYIRRFEVPVTLHLITKKPAFNLLNDAFPDISIIELKSNDSYRENIKRLKRKIQHLDIIFDFQFSPRTIILSFLLFVKFRNKYFTWNKRSLKRSLMVFRAHILGRKADVHINPVESEKRYFQTLVSFHNGLIKFFPKNISLYYKDVCPKIIVSKSSIKDWYDEQKIYIAINPGASHPGKEAPLEIFTQIINQLLKIIQKEISIILVGDEKAVRPCSIIKQNLEKKVQIIDLSGQLSLFNTAEVLSNCQVIVSNDGALAHLAEAVGTPTATLFGSTIESFGYQPFLPNSRAFSAMLGCRPCTKDGAVNCRYGDKKCFYSIDVNEVVTYLETIIKED